MKRKSLVIALIFLFLISSFNVVNLVTAFEENLKETQLEENISIELTEPVHSENLAKKAKNSITQMQAGIEKLTSNSASSHTKDEIKAKYLAAKPKVNFSRPEEAYTVLPVTKGPNYREGVLNEAAKADVLNQLNYYRWLSGVSSVQIKEDRMSYNAKGGVLLAVSDFSHTPAKPADMSEEFYNAALEGTGLPKGYWASGNASSGDYLPESIGGYVSDIYNVYSNNIGHRLSMLWPEATYTSFGAAGYQSCLTMFVIGNSSSNDKFYTWPPAGYCPIENTTNGELWSITLSNNYSYDLSNINLKLELNGKTYQVDKNYIYGEEFYNTFFFKLPKEVSNVIATNGIQYKAGISVKVIVDSGVRNTSTSQDVNIEYTSTFFAAEPIKIESMEIYGRNIESGDTGTYVTFNYLDGYVNGGEELYILYSPSNTTEREIKVTFSNPDVASYDSTENIIRYNKAGTTNCTIASASNPNINQSFNITVYNRVQKIEFSKDLYSLERNKTEQTVIKYTPTDNLKNEDKKITEYSSSNKNVATIDSNGKITAVNVGEATITAKINNNTIATSKVRVYAVPTSITLNKKEINMIENSSDNLVATVLPNDAENKTVTWTSSNESVATVDNKGNVKSFKAGVATITATTINGLTASCKVNVRTDEALVSYTTHVQNIGWQEYVTNGEMAGTNGLGLRLEGIKIKVASNLKGNVEYSTHIQNIGWQEFKSNDEMSGTSGRGLRLEAIKIRLTDELAEKFDIYYRVHAQNAGWLDWAKNGEESGTAGYGFRLEGIEIKLVKKGEEAPGKTDVPFKVKEPTVEYTTHVQNVGWQEYVTDGEMAGTNGLGLRLEGIKIRLKNANFKGNVEYSTHIQNIGWQDFKSNDEMSGTSGKALRLEAIKIRLTDELAEKYDIYYRVHAQNAGWLGWARNGEESGTAGYGFRLEGIEIRIVEKGAKAPGSTERPFVEK